MPNDPRKHHVVPRHYLSAFTLPSDPKRIWQYKVDAPISQGDRENARNPGLVALKTAGMEEHFYSFLDENGIDSRTYEEKLARLEVQYLPSLRALRAVRSQQDYTKFLQMHRADFVECIMLMNQRGFYRRNLVKLLFEEIKDDPQFPPTGQRRADENDARNDVARRPTPP